VSIKGNLEDILVLILINKPTILTIASRKPKPKTKEPLSLIAKLSTILLSSSLTQIYSNLSKTSKWKMRLSRFSSTTKM